MFHRKRAGLAVALASLAVAFGTVGAAVSPKLPGGAYTRSWIGIESSCAAHTLTSGETWKVPVDYYLDPAEAGNGTKLNMWIGGPWIDVPDGKYAKKRGHISYPDMFRQVPAKPGLQHVVFKFTTPPALPHNAMLLVCNFVDAAGNAWPWQVRREGPWFHRKSGYFELETDRPANLFRYQDPVLINVRLKAAAVGAGNRRLSYVVHDVTGAVVTQGAIDFVAKRVGQTVPIHLKLKQRGTFLIQAAVDGWETREITFCRIPDLSAVTHGAATAFGVTNVVVPGDPAREDEMCRAARLLGFSACRSFANWYEMEPGPGVYKLDAWQRALAIGRKDGINAWICINGPPAWALRGRMESFSTDYRSVRCDWTAWRDFVRTATTRFKGNQSGWEWLNEITPGGSQSPVDDYRTLCRIGTETAKSVDPHLTMLMAGGLWPRSYRLEMFDAGVAKWVDVLPIHYSNGDGVREARQDLDNAGRSQAAVWDDESAKGVNDWGVPPLKELANTAQSGWVLHQWTDELSAGAKKLIYFGGDADPCGNYSYLLDDLSPRPVAATLAVFIDKLDGARPLGEFSTGSGGVAYLFERDGHALLVCSSSSPSETVTLRVGSASLRRTDYQGNESLEPAPGGVARIQLTSIPVYLEGGDLDVLKSFVASQIQPVGAAQSAPGVETPHITLLRGRKESIYVRVRDLFGRPVSCHVSLDAPQGWPSPHSVNVPLKAGQTSLTALPIEAPASVDPRDYPARVLVRFSWAKLPQVARPCVLSVITPEMVGDLVPNGGFELADATGKGPAGWSVNGKTSLWASSAGMGDGLGSRVLEYSDSPGWVSSSRAIDLRGGQTYLYSAWVWNHNMQAGSNIGQQMADGTHSDLFDQQVFNCGTDSDGWQLYVCRYKAPVGLKQATFSPLAEGNGWARFDNIRVTAFEGTDYAAECLRAKTPPPINGGLAGWNTSCPIPLIGRNQLTALAPSYNWSPSNLSAVGYLMWDPANLYVAIRVRDDVHHPAGSNAGVLEGDSAILGIDPTDRSPGGAARAFAYYLSAASPGGGSGRATLYRPAQHAGGLRAGQLLKDSSIYDMAIRRQGGYTTYEMRLPFTQLGGLRPTVGGKMGLSLQVNDNDGKGLAARMNWGDGISPSWRPSGFGVVTFTTNGGS